MLDECSDDVVGNDDFRVVEDDVVVEGGVDDDSCFSLVNACKAEEHTWINHRGLSHTSAD